MIEFSADSIIELTTQYNWELIEDDGLFHLRQKDKHYMRTVYFSLSDDDRAKISDKLDGLNK